MPRPPLCAGQQVDTLKVTDVHHQLLTSKIIVTGGKDKAGRPILTIRPRFIAGKREDTLEVIKLQVYCIEKMLKANPESNGAFTAIVDVSGVSVGNFNPRLARALQETMAYRYPGQVELVVIYNPPTVFHAIYAIMQSFLPPSLKVRASRRRARGAPQPRALLLPELRGAK